MFSERTSVGLDVHARSIAGCGVDTVTGQVTRQRLVPTGVTISLLWDTGQCLALVRSDVTTSAQREARDELLAKLLAADLVEDDPHNPQHIGIRRSAGVVSLSRTHRLLHLVDGEE